MAMPARLREPLLDLCDGQLVVTIDTQARCLVAYPLPTWEALEQQIQNLPAMKPTIKRFQRQVLGYASELQLDGSGRMLLPAALRDYANLDRKLVLVGLGNKIELWSEQLWLAETEQALKDSDPDELPDELLNLKL